MSSEITINSNIASLQTQRRLGQSSSALNRVFERLSSGQRINRASDDAAGLAISDSLRADRRVLSQGIRNLNDGVSLLNIGEGALSELTNIITRIQELAEQAANGTLGTRQRQSLDKEAQQLSKEYTRIAQTVEFNGIKMFDGSVSSLTLQAGFGSSGAVVASIGGSKGTGTFAGMASYTTEATTSNDVTFGDLNGDGILDLVTAGASGANVMLGTGNGTFGAATSYTTESGISNAVTLGDLNNDGILDLVTAGSSGGNGRATVRIGVGNGTFGAATSYATVTIGQSYGVTLGDLNGDGILDLVTAGYSAGGKALVRFGLGNGTFGASRSYANETGGITNCLTLGDLNGDGLLDLVTAGYSAGGKATIRLGVGNGTFGAGTSYATETTESNGVTLGDLNGDGFLDLVTAGVGVSGFATVRLGAGNGTFGAARSYATETTESSAVALGDMNGDGILDLVTDGTGDGEGSATIRIGLGDGSFGAAISYSMEDKFTYGMALGDLNGDGILDIASAGNDAFTGRATVRLGETSSGVGALLPFSLQYRHTALQAMPDLDRALKRISSHRGHLGAFQSRVGSAINNVQITIENFAAAESQIRDTDVAQEAANLAKGRILQQAAASVLAQANLEPQIALTLLGAG